MKKLSNFMLIAISVAAIVNLRGLALMASGGLTTLTLSLLAAICFLIPSTYVCVKLSTHILKRGGVYEWVKVAFGPHWGFIAIWLEWINNIVEFPATLAAIIGMFLFLISPTETPSPWIFSALMLLVLWLVLWFNHLPLKISAFLNVIGSIGTFLIAALIISLGVLWMITDTQQLQPIQKATSFSLGQIAIFVSFIGAYSGMQITGFHISDVKNPKRQYALALPIAAIIIIAMMLGASSIMALLIPSSQLNVIAGIEQMVRIFFLHFHLPNVGIMISIWVLIAMLSSFSAWLIGPARGLQVALDEANVQNIFSRLNRFQMPIGILWLQGIITTVLISAFLLLPTIKTAFWVMITITSQFTALMYMLVFAAGLKLIAKSLLGKILCLLGLLTCLVGFIVGIIAPSELKLVTLQGYTLMVLMGDAIIILLGFLFAKWLTARSK